MKRIGYLVTFLCGLMVEQALAQSKVVVNETITANDNVTKTYIIVEGLTIRPPDATSSIVYTATSANSYVFRLANPGPSYADPSNDKNYVRSEKILIPNILEESQLSALSNSQKATTFEYSDGLGKPLQTVSLKSSPTGKDMVQPKEFDDFGREVKEYLPYTIQGNGAFQSGFVNQQDNFYSNEPKIPHDDAPWLLKEFDNSPLNEVRSSFGPGKAWHNVEGGNNKPTTSLLRTNGGGVIKKFDHSDGVDVPQVSGYWVANTLTISEGTDEEGFVKRTYKDFRGLTVLEEVGKGAEWHQTYFVYNQAGKTTWVFPPQASALIDSEYQTLDDTGKTGFLNRWCFQYTYDDYQRLATKRIPGTDEATTYVYDKWDRLVLTQQPNDVSSRRWIYSKYDAHNREITKGFVTTPSEFDLDDIQTAVMNSSSRYEIENSTEYGYALSATYPVSPPVADLLEFAYYDDYSFLGISTWDNENAESVYHFVSEAGFPGASDVFVNTQSVKGQPTGAKVKVMVTGENRWLNSVSYYDKKYRVIQTISENYVGGIDRVTNDYDFTGNLLKSKLVHTGNNSVTILKEFTYDHGSRLLTTHQTIDSGPRVLLASNQYNELGQLVEKNLHAVNGSPFLQSVDYRYNIRGWITHINNSTLSPDANNNDTNDLFGMELVYNQETLSVDGITTPLYNGNVSAIRWKTNLVDISFPNKPEQVFKYQYDAFSRLQKATYASKLSGAWTGNLNFFNEAMTYDKNGNLLTLKRNAGLGGTSTQIDDLEYHYTSLSHASKSNVLRFTHDKSPHWTGDVVKGYVENTAHSYNATEGQNSTEYEYDANGNVRVDINKGITNIAYNYLNLPERIEFTGGRVITYKYDATGAKLQETTTDGSTTETYYYDGGILYKGNSIVQIATDEGRVVKNGTSYDYEYFLKDHQNNMRVAFGAFKEVREYKATMEPAITAKEEGTAPDQYAFKNISKRQALLHDRTVPTTEVPSPAYSAETNGFLGKAVGPAKMLSVTAGDRVQLEAFARYTTSTNNTSVVTNFLALVTTGTFGITATETGYSAISNGIGAVPIAKLAGVPKAYLFYIVFDNTYTARQYGYVPVTSAAQVAHERLAYDLAISHTGFLYTYVANESYVNGTTSVYFDDFTIVHERINTSLQVTQASDYYPFGLSFNQYSRQRPGASNAQLYGNQHLFQAQELQKSFGLNWYQYKYRMHDPALGRFGAVDPLAEKYLYNSTYAFSENRLIDGIELEGAEFYGTTMSSTWDYGAALNYTQNFLYNTWDATKQVGLSTYDAAGMFYGGMKYLATGDYNTTTFSSQGPYQWGSNKGWEVAQQTGGTLGGSIVTAAAFETVNIGLTAAPYVRSLFSSPATQQTFKPNVALGGEAVAANGVASGAQYSVAYEMNLASSSYPGVYRGAHFLEANKALGNAIASDAGFASSISRLGISIPRSPTGAMLGKSPTGWVWHHDIGAGVMQLVPKSQHTIGSSFWNTLHPNGLGGFAIWGK